MSRWLLEIGCEELPAQVCASLLQQLRGDQQEGLQQEGLVQRVLRDERLLSADFTGEQLRVLVSPRRVAVQVTGVPARQSARAQVFRGPRADVAFGPDGAPTKAGLGFARSRGVTVDELGRETVAGTTFVCARVEAERLPAAEVLPRVSRALIEALQVPRGMRWGSRPADQTDYLRFSRPIRWLVCKLESETIVFPFYDLVSGDVSRGHRALGGTVIIAHAEEYERALQEHRVIVDQERRRELILSGLTARAEALGGRWLDPGDVLAEATYLVESPSVENGRFSAAKLRLPPDVLITAMQSHQRYFPVCAPDGQLLPVFLYVSNADPAFAELVTRGNQRVLEGRLDDAEFAYERDAAEGLRNMARRLDKVVFHERLGTLAEKTIRLREMTAWLSSCTTADAALRTTLDEAAAIAKADLVSQVVIEFPSLQGTMGGVYATVGGFPEAVARAVAEHYLPLSATAPVPSTLSGGLLAVADKADNIIGAWVAGEKPSGSRDPYGLRRAAMGIVRISLQYTLRFSLRALVDAACMAYERQHKGLVGEDGAQEMFAFVRERLEALLLEEGVPYDVVAAAFGSSAEDIPGLAARARAFAALRETPALQDAAVAYTRCASLAMKAAEQGDGVDQALFADAAENELFTACRAAVAPIHGALEHLAIERALTAAAGLRPTVDRYFDAVLVMDADPAVRANRLAQLAEVRDLLGAIGDLGRMAI